MCLVAQDAAKARLQQARLAQYVVSNPLDLHCTERLSGYFDVFHSGAGASVDTILSDLPESCKQDLWVQVLTVLVAAP